MQCFKLKTINLSKLQLAANNDLETEAQINHLNRSMEGKGQEFNETLNPYLSPTMFLAQF